MTIVVKYYTSPTNQLYFSCKDRVADDEFRSLQRATNDRLSQHVKEIIN